MNDYLTAEANRQSAALHRAKNGYYVDPNKMHTIWLSDNELLAKHIDSLELENAKLRETLEEISTTAHCIALAGPLHTPTLQDAWGKFMQIDTMAKKALSK